MAIAVRKVTEREGTQNTMTEETAMTTSDVVIGIVAGLGVVVLIVVFIWVCYSTFMKGNDNNDV